jgi:hypothetical protein
VSDRRCYCDSRQCEICTPSWKDFVQVTSTDNYRLANIVEAADKLAEAIEAYQKCGTAEKRWGVKRALDAFKVVRQGQ